MRKITNNLIFYGVDKIKSISSEKLKDIFPDDAVWLDKQAEQIYKEKIKESKN